MACTVCWCCTLCLMHRLEAATLLMLFRQGVQAGQAGTSSLQLDLAWSVAADGPILVSPAVDEGSGTIVCGTVKGQLLVISPAGASVAWSTELPTATHWARRRPSCTDPSVAAAVWT